MVETPIQMRDVLRHQQNACMVTEASKTDFVIAKSSIEKGKIEQNVLENYLAKSRGDGSKENVYDLLQLEISLEKNNTQSIIPYFTNEIIPHVKDMNDLLIKVDNSNISDNKKEEIKEAVKEAKVINRIIKNHSVISKNMNYESELNYYQLSKNSDRFIRKVCETVNNLNAPQYAKLNIALEEVLYDDYAYGLAIPKKYCVEAVTDYFLFSDFDKFTFNEYCRLLKENRCISYSDCEGIKYLFESETFANADDVKDLIAKYKKDDNKNASKLQKIVKKVYSLPPEAIINETPTLFGVIRGSLLLVTFSVSVITGIVLFMVDRFIQYTVRKEQAEKMRKYFKDELDKVDNLIDETTDEKKKEKLETYKKCLDKCTDKIVEYRNKLYTDKELDAEWNFEDSASSVPSMRLNEFKLYKFNNLMDVTKYANKYIETVYSRAKDSIKNKINNSIFRPIGEKDYVNENNLVAHMDRSDDRICICIESFEFDNVDYAHNEMTRLCEALNSATNNPRYLFFYEYTAEDRMELYLKEATPITLTNKESEEQASMFTGMDFNRICNIELINELMDNENLLEFTLDLLDEDVSIKDKVTHKVSNIKNNTANKVDKVKDNLSRQKEIGENDSKEKSFKGINLNSIKLALAGTKKKTKDLSAKEQELSRQLDYTADNLVRSIQNALTNDRREGLIKGSVIPSFSKCIKICIALAGTGYFAGPGIAMIAALVGLVNSKRLNFKERALLLDEIEIELKIVEKEINLAESDNNIKKLRDLMQYQKTLQREYQRLKYNLKVKSRTTTITGNANTNVTHTLNGRNFGIKRGDD